MLRRRRQLGGPANAWQIYDRAIRWAISETYSWYQHPLQLLAYLVAVAFALGFRRGLVYLVPWLSVLPSSPGPRCLPRLARLPEHRPFHAAMEVVIPLIVAVVAMALEGELAAASSRRAVMGQSVRDV